VSGCSCMALESGWKASLAERGKGRQEGHTKICLVNSTDVSLKYAVGPSGRCTSVIASIHNAKSAQDPGLRKIIELQD
jgi:hypothetical protein